MDYESWNAQQVASVLTSPKSLGGAGLSVDDVKPLYEAGFKGSSLHNIVENIKKKDEYFALKAMSGSKDFTQVSENTCQTVVFWVLDQLMTRQYSLWQLEPVSKQVIQKLGEPIAKGGADLSLDQVSSLDSKTLYSIAKDVVSSKETSFIRNLDLSSGTTLVQWVKQFLLQNHKIQIELKKIPSSISFEAPIFNNLAYQNNKNTVEMMADVLIGNIYKHMTGQALRDQELLINSAYFGSGKTRLGVEFLALWKKQMSKHPEMRKKFEVDYSKAAVEQLEKSKVIYVDCRTYRIINNLQETFSKLTADIERYIGGSITSTPCYIIIDEIGSWVNYYEPLRRPNIHRYFCAMYDILNEFILPFQKISTVSLYVCGKGAFFLDIIGHGKLRPTLQSPTIVKAVHLEALSRKHIESGIANSDFVGSLVSHFKELNLFDYFLDQIQEETQGVPNYVVHYVFNNRKLLLNCKTKENIDQALVQIRSTLSTAFKAPFEQFSNHPILMKVYQYLLFAGISKLEATTTFKMDEFTTNGTEFEGVTNLSTYDIATMLNCFLQPVKENRYRLLFPKAIIDQYVTSATASSNMLAISHIVEEYGPVLSLGNIMEHLTLVNFRLRMNWGSIQKLNIGEVFPFLKNTCVENIPCKPLEVVNLRMKLMTNETSNLNSWKKVIAMLDGGKLGCFYDHSHSPDKIWQINLGSKKIFIMIQDKNVGELSISKLREEIDKNEKIRKALDETIETKLIMVFMVRGNTKFSGHFLGGTTIGGIPLHRHTSVIILTEEEISDFLGDKNLEALQKLSGLKKQD